MVQRRAVQIGDDVEVMNLDGTVAYRGRVVHVGASVTVRADGSSASIAEHPASVRRVHGARAARG